MEPRRGGEGAVVEARSGGHRRWRLAAAGGDGVDLGVAGLPEALGEVVGQSVALLGY
jgi:hypothetical protein